MAGEDFVHERIQSLMVEAARALVITEPWGYDEIINSFAAPLADQLEAAPDVEEWSIEWGDPDGPTDLRVQLRMSIQDLPVTFTIGGSDA